MSWIRVIVAVDYARNDNLQGRLPALHHVDLDRRGMSPQHDLGRNEEGVLHLTCRVVSRNVKGSEVVIVVLDVWAAGNLETHGGEDGDGVVERLQQGMQRAVRPLLARNSNINPIGCEAAGALFLLPA